MKALVMTVFKSRWTLVIILAVVGLVSGSALSDQVGQLITSLLGQ